MSKMLRNVAPHPNALWLLGLAAVILIPLVLS